MNAMQAHLAPPNHFKIADNRRASFDAVFLSNDYKNNLVNTGIYYDGANGYKCAYCSLYLKRLDTHQLKYHTFSLCPQATIQLYKNVTLRKESFRKFKIARAHFKDNYEFLAQNGFYYYGKKVEIRCSCCQIVIVKLNKTDNVSIIHRTWSPECHFNMLPSPTTKECMKKTYVNIYPQLDSFDVAVDVSVDDKSSTAAAPINDDTICKVCMDLPRDTCFLPCAHLVTCSACAKRCKDCCVCRAKIKERLPIYLQ
ncbi:IAP-2 [Mythimna sequax nucleopolyhedrovirus]|nr:IAP-2 [Mythimna sequax nucleopolyhedrovirus]